MADLENLLLEAAGRTGTGGRNRHLLPSSRRRREGSYSDGGSDSRDDDSDDGHGYASRKPSGSQVPLKKRLDPSERDDDQGSQEEGNYDDAGSDRERDSSDESDVGDDLYKNEDDSRSWKETLPLPSSRGVRSSARSADRAAAKDDALNELRAKRLKQQDPEAYRKLRDASRGSSGSRVLSPVKRKPFTASSLSSSSQSESESRYNSEDEGSTVDGGMADSDDESGTRGPDGPTFDDIKEITIRRSKLAKWFMEPFFEELIVGCFVRVGIGRSKSGPIYRLCMVRNVDATDPERTYKLENKTTHKYLNGVWGNESSAARRQMAMISDSPPQEVEFRQLIREVERSGGRMLSKQDPRRDLEIAQNKHDEAEVERIKTRLQQLEASRKAQEKDVKAVRLAEMNRKNRVENFKNASGLKPVNTALKAGEAGYDPFSRRWTRSRNYYVAKPLGGDAAAVANGDSNGAIATGNGNDVRAAAEAGRAATAAALQEAAGARKLVDTSAPVDEGTESYMLHDFEIPISLNAHQKFGGAQGAVAGFIARKQRIEATVGCRVPENDGRRHALTLTVSDYKRRRGLL
ncbi:hypothetical protein CRYUN_Cryun37aG0111400 [Craigia yunnanensis]